MRSPERLRQIRSRSARVRARLARALAAARGALAAGRARVADGWAGLRAFLVALAGRLGRLGRTTVRVALLILLVSTVLAGGAYAASTLSAQYGGSAATANARAWAERTPTISRSACQSCHPTEAAIQASGLHATVTCEVCHGPQGAHPGPSGGPLVSLATTPTSALCATCHTQVAGRPAALPQVDLAIHYSGGPCLFCHDPHTIVALAPPQVTHPLANLPACTTCHNPAGLKKIPAGHELVEDAVCLRCHGVWKPGA